MYGFAIKVNILTDILLVVVICIATNPLTLRVVSTILGSLIP